MEQNISVIFLEGLIELSKKDFSGDASYLSGVNDGMHHLKRKLLELDLISGNSSTQNNELVIPPVSNSVASYVWNYGAAND